MKRAALLSILLAAGWVGVASADECRPYSPYTHHPYYPCGWYVPKGCYWVQWWGLREPYTPPSGTAWIPNPMRYDLPVPHVPAPNCDSPTIKPFCLGYVPCLGATTAPTHDVQVTVPCEPYGSWQHSLRWLRCK